MLRQQIKGQFFIVTALLICLVRNQSSELAKDVAGAEALLEQHQEHKGGNESRTSSFMLTAETWKCLLNEDIEETDEFCQCLQEKNETLDSGDFVCKMRSLQALKQNGVERNLAMHGDSYDYQRFLSDYRDLMQRVDGMVSDNLANGVTGAESTKNTED